MTVSEVAAIFHVTSTTVLRMIRQRRIPATQACANAPWILMKNDIDALRTQADGDITPPTFNPNQLTLTIQ